MAVDEIGPVPPGAVAGARPTEVPSTLQWFNDVLARIQRASTTTKRGGVLQAAVVADLNQVISNPPTQAEVQAISDKVDELLAALRTAEQVDT